MLSAGRDAGCCRPGGTVLSAGRDGVVGRRDGVVGRAGRCSRPGGTVLSAECVIGGERLGVDADRPVGRLDYRFVVVGCSDCEFRFRLAIWVTVVAFSSLGRCCSV